MKELLKYYSVLDVHPSAEIEAIKSNYRRLAKKYHPDVYTGSKDEAERIMSDLNEAMRILSNKHLRHSYDAEQPTKFSKFSDYEDFSETGFESRTSDCIKKTNKLYKDANAQIKSKIYLFDPNPNTKNYLGELLSNENIKYFNIALDNSNTTKKFSINK